MDREDLRRLDLERGDLIETYKMLNGLVEYGQRTFKKSRSGEKIISVPFNNGNRNIPKISDSFISLRVFSSGVTLKAWPRSCHSSAKRHP